MPPVLTLRESLEKAMTESEGEEGSPADGADVPEAPAAEPAEAPAEADPAGGEQPPPAESKEQKSEAERARHGDGRFAKKTGKGKPAAPAAKGQAGAVSAPAAERAGAAPGAGTVPVPAPGVEQPAAAADESVLKPPASWKPLAREQWAKLPKDVREEVLRVDGEVRRTMQSAAQHRQVVDVVQQTLQPHLPWLSEGGQKQPLQTVGALLQAVQPFEGMIRAEGSDAVRAVGSLLRTAHTLRFGSPQVKARLIATLVRNDLGGNVELLADAIDGKLGALDAAPPRDASAAPAPVDASAIARQVRAEVQKDLERQGTARMLQEERTAADRFLADKEFADVVRPLMADLVEIRARQGIALSVEQAYQEALQLHPEIAPVLKQRGAAAAAKEKEKSRQQARAAASSVRTQPAGTAAPAGKPGLRATLDRVWDEQSQDE